MATPRKFTGGEVQFQWFGGNFNTYQRSASRDALEQAGGEMVEIAQGLVHTDTFALQQSTRFEVPPSRRLSDALTLRFGVWLHPDNAIRLKYNKAENPADYAEYQENMPPPIGKPFLGPALDQIAPKINGYIADRMPRLATWGRLNFTSSADTFGISAADGGEE